MPRTTKTKSLQERTEAFQSELQKALKKHGLQLSAGMAYPRARTWTARLGEWLIKRAGGTIDFRVFDNSYGSKHK